MYVVCVTVHVKPEHIAAFAAATETNARSTREEKGNFRFDVLQSLADPAHFLLYEVYESEAAFQEHQKTAHYLSWRDVVSDWMAEPRSSVKCAAVFPREPQEW